MTSDTPTETVVTDPKVVVSNGMRFPVNRKLLSKKVVQLLRRGQYEDREYNAVSSLVRPDDVVIELGAGLGYMSTVAAVKRKAKAVHAFEANPRMIPYIREVHRLNGATQAEVHNVVLGQTAGTATFYIREDFQGSSLTPRAQGRTSDVVEEVQVEVRDIAATFRDIAPTFLICDIEGAEADLLPAADLSGLRCAVIELHPQWIRGAGVRAVFDAFHGAGLTFYPRTSNKKVVTFRRDW